MAQLVGAVLGGRVARACDDPPFHYAEPCRAAAPQNRPQFAYALERELFTGEGLDLPVDFLPFAALANAWPDYALTQMPARMALEAAAAGAEPRIFATVLGRLQRTLWALDDAPARSGFDGRTIALGAPGTGYRLALHDVLAAMGTDPARTRVVPMASPERYAALQAGVVDVIVLAGGADEPRANELGFVSLGTTTISFAADVLVAPRGMLEDNHNLTFYVRCLRALLAANAALREDPASAVAVLQRRFDLDEATARAILAAHALGATEPTLDVAATRAILDDLALWSDEPASPLRAVDLEALHDRRVVNALRG